jgi:hypothetical protein
LFLPGGGNGPAEGTAPRGLELSQVTGLVEAATLRWRRAGVDRQTLEASLANLTFVIADLPGRELAMAGGSTIVIDLDGAGHGWFIDATPGNDREFQRSISRSERQATGRSPAAAQVDLLSVLSHEIGHVLGVNHSEVATNVMQDELSLGTRRNPTAHDAAIVEWLFSAGRRERGR